MSQASRHALGSALRAVPGARLLSHAVRSGLEALRPFPLPAYKASPPAIGADDPMGSFLPPTAATLAEAAMSEEAANFVSSVLEKLKPSLEINASRYYYRYGRARYGRHWRYADLPTVLWAAAMLLRPERYLEIGVRQGRSAAVVGAVSPRSEIYGFDLWLADYGGEPNPGPDFVRSELRASGHAGAVELVSGDSKETLPAFLRRHRDLYFDVITIDGDKSVRGFASDLAHALPRLKLGGIVVTDDLPLVPTLRRVWRRVVEDDTRYAAWEFALSGKGGVAAAVRVG